MLNYRVYKNSSDGGPIDFATPLVTTASLTYTTAALAYPFDHYFLVRTYDTVSMIEDLNTDARVRLTLDASGVDITNRPSPAADLSAQPIAAAGLRVEWSYLATGSTAPTGFKVWAQVGTINYALTPSGTTAYGPGQVAYQIDIAGLTDATTYTVAVRAYNATADDGSTATTTGIADGAGPAPVVNLTGQSTY